MWKVAVAVTGAALVVGGILLLPLPGPGWLVIIAGLAVLATEFAWAKGILERVRSFVRSWTSWVMARPLPVRGVIALAGMTMALALMWLSLRASGAAHWLPESAASALRLG